MDEQQKAISPRVVIQMLLFIVVTPLLPLLISGRWGWWEAWLYAIICIMGFAISRVLAARHHPDLLAERVRSMQREDAKPWDRFLSPAVGLGSGTIPLVAGLDALLGWSPTFSLPTRIVALAIILAGYALGTYALVENRFFSGVVRIQAERGHQVVSSGPYRWIRHPGYAGALLVYLATPLLLDSSWAFLPATLISILLVIRTHLEDQALQDELEGYREYAKRVRYRLLPRMW